jgi:photosystem II stability/assembly factor-like uncharacterized protein
MVSACETPVKSQLLRCTLFSDKEGTSISEICWERFPMSKLLLITLFCCELTLIAQDRTAPITVTTIVGGGPSGGPVHALAVDPRNNQTVYAGTDRGTVFKSVDAGENWNPATSGISSTRAIHALAVSPANSNVIYAATDGAGVFKSTNAAGSWNRLDSGFKSQQVFSLAVHPSSPETIYAGAYGGWVYKSTNGGIDWSELDLGVRGTWIFALVIDPDIPSTIYAATGGDNHHTRAYGVFKSTDSGRTWKAINSGLPLEWIFSLAIDPSAPNTLYVGFIGLRKALYKTTDGGQTWSPVAPEPSLYPSAIYAIAISNRKKVHLGYGDSLSDSGGLITSLDDGSSWQKPTAGFPNSSVNVLTVDPTESSTIYAGTQMGIFKSTDGGETWRDSSRGIGQFRINTIAIALDPTVLYLGTQGGGAFKSTDGGKNWVTSSQGLPTPNVCVLAVDPSDSSNVYAGINGAPFRQPNVYRSRDRGATWVGLDSAIPAMDVCALAIDSSDANTIYAGSTLQGLFKTTDGGKNWARVRITSDVSFGGVYSILMSPANPNTIHARTFSGIFASGDKGENWVPVIPRLEPLFLGGRGPNHAGLAPQQYSRPLAIDPQDSSKFYAASSSDQGLMLELFESADGGKNWTPINASLAPLRIRSLAVDPSNSSDLYAGTDYGLFISTDVGRNWLPLRSR